MKGKLFLVILSMFCNVIASSQVTISSFKDTQIQDLIGLSSEADRNEDGTWDLRFYRGDNLAYRLKCNAFVLDSGGFGLLDGKAALLYLSNPETLYEIYLNHESDGPLVNYKFYKTLGKGTYLMLINEDSEVITLKKAIDENVITSWTESDDFIKGTYKAPKVDEKYIPVDFLKHFKGLYPKSVVTNKVVFPDGSSVNKRNGLLFLGKDGDNFMIVLSYTIMSPLEQLCATYSFKSHPDLGNIISVQVAFETDVATITAKNGKVVDYQIVGKLKPGTYAIPLDDKGCNKGVFRVNLPDNKLDYWYFQREDCTLSPNIIKESSTQFEYK